MTNKNLPGRRLRPGRIATSARHQRRVRLADEGVKISDLPDASRLLEDEVFPLVQDGETRKATLGQVRDLIPAGEEGASAYEIWLDEGFEGTEADFLDWLRGEDGQDGKDGNPGQNGQSAYQIWLAAGNEGSEQEFLASLKGEAGTDGEPGQEGKSAYEIWLDAGNEGTEEDFLEWLRANATVEIDPQKTNLVTSNPGGLFVNGVHPIIPKFVSATLNGLLDTFKSLADGTRVYTMTISMANPLGIAQLGGVSIQRYLSAEPQYYFTNENDQYIATQYFITGTVISASTIQVTVSVIMADKPYKCWELSSFEEVGSAEEGNILQCKLSIRLLAGTTVSQNGMS